MPNHDEFGWISGKMAEVGMENEVRLTSFFAYAAGDGD